MKFAALAIFTLALAGTALGQLERDRLCLTGLPVTPGFSIEAVSIPSSHQRTQKLIQNSLKD